MAFELSNYWEVLVTSVKVREVKGLLAQDFSE